MSSRRKRTSRRQRERLAAFLGTLLATTLFAATVRAQSLTVPVSPLFEGPIQLDGTQLENLVEVESRI